MKFCTTPIRMFSSALLVLGAVLLPGVTSRVLADDKPSVQVISSVEGDIPGITTDVVTKIVTDEFTKAGLTVVTDAGAGVIPVHVDVKQGDDKKIHVTFRWTGDTPEENEEVDSADKVDNEIENEGSHFVEVAEHKVQVHITTVIPDGIDGVKADDVEKQLIDELDKAGIKHVDADGEGVIPIKVEVTHPDDKTYHIAYHWGDETDPEKVEDVDSADKIDAAITKGIEGWIEGHELTTKAVDPAPAAQ